ncbi:MAG: hypothetical protein SPL05_05935 [Eubacteriales bacterium]|nr:hypothetical protein [Eubacteriales bacterium]
MYGDIWIKLYKKHKIKNDYTISAEKENTEQSLYEAYKHLDISAPIWSKKNFSEWENHNITRFFADDFMDEFPYDSMELVFILHEEKNNL